MIQHPRVLISTIQPSSGGVPAKVLWVIGELQSLGLVPVVAWYEPWSRTPILSVPAHALASFRRPGVRTEPVFGDVEGHGLGAWLPELEFTHYRPCRDWRQLIGSCQFHLAVTGNPLCAFRFTVLELPFLAWVGTPWEGDRVDRVRTFPLPRRLLDQGLNAPVLRRMERKVLQDPRGRILAISQVTADALEEIGGRPMDGVLYLPPDASLFLPLPQKQVPWRIGFSGRYSDPRKRIGSKQEKDIETERNRRLNRQRRDLCIRAQGTFEQGYSGSGYAQDGDPQQHGAFMIAPCSSEFIEPWLFGMAVGRNQQDGHIRPEKQRHQNQKCQTAKRSLRNGKGCDCPG